LEEFSYGNNTQNNGAMRSQKISFNGLSKPFEQTYAYDDLNRLQSSTETINNGATTTWKQTFQYDRYGNRTFDGTNTTNLSQSSPTKVTNPLINTSDNRLKKFQDGDALADYDYDKTGNLTQDSEGKQFLYDAENHQKEVKVNGVSKGKYLYDGDGRRVKKISDLETTIFVYNGGGQLVAEYSTQQSSTPQVSYLTADHLGSPRIITDNVGKVIARKDFNAFGDETSSAQRTDTLGYKPEEIRQDYTGYQKDDESGLEFAQARYYNNKHGRFTSVDPLVASANVKDPQTFNRYSYAMNSPYKFTDPLGLVVMDAGGGSSSGGDVGHSHLSNNKGLNAEFSDPEPKFTVSVSATVTSPAPTAMQAHEAAHLAAQGDDTIDASTITPTVLAFNSAPTTTGGTATFDAAVTTAATSVAITVEQNMRAYYKNKENWRTETDEFNGAIDSSMLFEAYDMTDYTGSTRPTGTVQADGTITGVPTQGTSGKLVLPLPIQWEGSEITIANKGAASADKANSQIKLVNEMESSGSIQRANFIKANAGKFMTVTGGLLGSSSKGRREVIGASNAGIIYDMAVKRGLAAAAANAIK
jgi:RHS repeat-associated protein